MKLNDRTILKIDFFIKFKIHNQDILINKINDFLSKGIKEKIITFIKRDLFKKYNIKANVNISEIQYILPGCIKIGFVLTVSFIAPVDVLSPELQQQIVACINQSANDVVTEFSTGDVEFHIENWWFDKKKDKKHAR